MKTNDFLLEIFTEELPPKSLEKLSLALLSGIEEGLKNAELTYDTITPFATPRRLAVLVSQLMEIQPDQKIERRGPAISAAFDEQGKPTQATIGFAKSCKTSVQKLETVTTEKGEWLSFNKIEKGKSVFKLVPEIVNDAIKKLPIPRPMRWGNHKIEFIRPVHSVVMLYGKKVIPAEILGIKTSNKTLGHRFLSHRPIIIKNPKDYAMLLKTKGSVIADFETRKNIIEQQLNSLITKTNQSVYIDPKLLNDVTALVEWPKSLRVYFPKHFLSIPKEVLISCMQSHQRCFPIVDSHNELLNCFITVANIDSKDPKEIIKGNERVMVARLADAEFFYKTDLKHTLEHYRAELNNVIFQKELGTLYDKTERTAKIATWLAQQTGADCELAKRAAELSKADLMTNMIGEFPELQGIMGQYYAKHGKEPDAIAIALNEQYMPRGAGDDLPTTTIGCILAIADRIDTLVGTFGINKIPTGDKDPYGLRRAALGIIRIIIETNFKIDLLELINQSKLSYLTYTDLQPNVIRDVFEFILERLKYYLLEQGFTTEEFNAVEAIHAVFFDDFYQRIEAVKVFHQLPEAESLAAANKRVSNILAKQELSFEDGKIDTALLQEPAEKQLAQLIEEKKNTTEIFYQKGNYIELLSELATLKNAIDNFFDHVMVMVDDKALCHNRLTILTKLRNLFLQVADIAKLQM